MYKKFGFVVTSLNVTVIIFADSYFFKILHFWFYYIEKKKNKAKIFFLKLKNIK